MTVGERIKEIRNKLNMSQVDFADKINVSKQTLYKYENNIITNIPSDKIEAAAKLGNISPAYLMGWESASDEKTKNITSRSKEFEFPLNIRSAARDLMELSDSDQELAINMIHSLAKKGRKANED